MDDVEQQDAPELTYEVQSGEGGVTTLTLGGELDIGNIERLEEAVAPTLATHPNRLVIDVEALRFADSSGIALWLRWAAEVGQIELRNVPPLLRRVIASMGLDAALGLAA